MWGENEAISMVPGHHDPPKEQPLFRSPSRHNIQEGCQLSLTAILKCPSCVWTIFGLLKHSHEALILVTILVHFWGFYLALFQIL